MTPNEVHKTDVPLEGESIVMGGMTWIVPPLNLKALRRLRPQLAMLGNPDSDEGLAAMLEVIRSALERNYPGMSTEVVEELVDMGNLGEVLGAVIRVSGLVPKLMERAQTVGALSPGMPSMPASPVQQDGPGSTSVST